MRRSTARTTASLIILLATASPLRGQERDTQVLSLAAAVDLARRNSPRVHESLSRIEESRIRHREAQSAFRPRFEPRMSGAIGGGSDLANQSYGAGISQRFRWGTAIEASVASTSSRNQLGTFYYTDTTVALSHPLYRGGSVDVERREAAIAARDVDAALDEHGVVEHRAAIDAAAAYYAIVAQEQVIQTAAKALERHRHLVAVSEAKLEIGTVSQLDVLRARQLVREAESQLEDARSVADDARDQLRLLIGAAGLEPIAVSPDIPVLAEPIDVESAVQLAREHSGDVRRARADFAVSQQQARAARRPVLPRIDFTLALTRRETGPSLRASFGSDRFRLVPFLQMSLPGVARGERLAAIEAARRERELRAAEAKVEVEARRTLRNRARLINSLRAAEERVAFALQEVDVARTRFERGLSNNLDLVTAEGNLLAAESRRIAVAAALAVATLQVKASIGTLNLDEDFKTR